MADLSPIAKLFANNLSRPEESRRCLTPCIPRKSASSRTPKMWKKLSKPQVRMTSETSRAVGCFDLLRNQSTSSNSFLPAAVSNAKSKKISNGQGKQPRCLRKRESSMLGKGKWALSRQKMNARRSAAKRLFAHLGSAATCTSIHASFHNSDTCLRCLYQKRQHAWRMMCMQPNGQSWLMESQPSHSELWALGCSICCWMRDNTKPRIGKHKSKKRPLAINGRELARAAKFSRCEFRSNADEALVCKAFRQHGDSQNHRDAVAAMRCFESQPPCFRDLANAEKSKFLMKEK